jgi:hypothetical protein
MIYRRPLVTLPIVLLAGFAGRASALNTYLPISQAVSRGSYCSPNYLSTVATAVGRNDAYHMFNAVVTDRYPHLVGRFGKDEILVQALRKSRIQRRQLLGFYAEDRFIEVNRDAGWQKVANRFAPQRDVWRRTDGRIQFAQIKVHGPGPAAPTMRDLAAVYLDSMRKDSGRGQASLFLVPDDHVDAIRSLIDDRRRIAIRNGDTKEAVWLLNQKERLSPLGTTYDSLATEADLAQSAGRARIVARCAGPLITVVFLAGSVGYDTYRWSAGGISGSELVVQVGKAGSVFTVGLATAYLLSKSEWMMFNPYRVGGVVTAVVFFAEEGWLVYQSGGLGNACAAPGFYVKTGGNVGAATLGIVGAVEGGKFGAWLGTPFGPCGPFIGGGVGAVLGGAFGGMVGYLGGAALTDWMLETFSPKFYYGLKMEEIDRAETRFSDRVGRLLDLSQPFASD